MPRFATITAPQSSLAGSIRVIRVYPWLVNAKEEIAKPQSQQLEELLKPENIERALAGIGSTKPEELREQRRRELTIEKTAVAAQLEQLTLRRVRLEEAIAASDAQAYQQSAKQRLPVENSLHLGLATSSRWLAMLLASIAAIGSLLVGLVAFRNYLSIGLRRGFQMRSHWPGPRWSLNKD